MKKAPLRLISATLVMAVVLSAAACDKKPGAGPDGGTDLRDQSHSGEKVAEDSPWFNAAKSEVRPELDKSRKVSNVKTEFAGADEKYIATLTSGNYEIPEMSDWNNFNSNDYAISTITVVDRKTMQVCSSIDLIKGLSKDEHVESVHYDDGKITVVYSDTQHIDDDNTIEFDVAIYDPATGKEAGRKTHKREYYIMYTFYVGCHRIEASLSNDNGVDFFYLFVTSDDGSEKTIEMKKGGVSIGNMIAPIPVGKDKILIEGFANDGSVFFEADLKAGTIKEVDKNDYSWLKADKNHSAFMDKEGAIYYTTANSVASVDMETKTLKDVFNFSWCGENRNMLSFLSVVECSPDRILLCGDTVSYNVYNTSQSEPVFHILEFTKADKNPHAGKTIMELYVPDGLVISAVADAINKFNSTNDGYFIEVTSRYQNNALPDSSQITSMDDIESVELNNKSKISNQLAMDLLNGTGPDILLNVSDLGQINSPTYLADLSKYVGTLDPEKYYTNIVEASRVNGALYQMPLSIGIEGIMTDSKNAGASGVGFTTAEYEKFLKGPLNGKDVIEYGQPYYFARLFNAMREKFITDKKADFSGPEFAALAEYVKNNVRAKAESWMTNDNETGTPPGGGVGVMIFKGDSQTGFSNGYFGTCYSFGNYFEQVVNIRGDLAILGLPSTDGRGPSYAPIVSVAVSAQAKSVDACGEFVKMLMSEEIMESIGISSGFVISRAANRKVGDIAIEHYNGDGGFLLFDSSLNGKRITFTKEHIDKLEKAILSCSRSNISDAAINLIMIEEMQAYFAGQKDIKDVASIAQDRVQKVLSERG